MVTRDELLGTAYVPWTFPTVTVANNARQSGVMLSHAVVDRIWDAYKEATIKDGLPPFVHDRMGGNEPLIVALERKTNLLRNDIVAWLNATEQTVNQGWDYKWIDPSGALRAERNAIESAQQLAADLNPFKVVKEITRDAGEAVSNFLKPSTEPVVNILKWTAIAVAGGAAIYMVYQGSQIIRATKRRRRSK